MDFNRILNGMLRAAKLDKAFYEEVEHDTSYNQDALAVVVLAALAGGIGSFLGTLFITRSGLLAAIGSLIFGVVVAVAAYFVWVFVAQYVGTRFFKGGSRQDEVVDGHLIRLDAALEPAEVAVTGNHQVGRRDLAGRGAHPHRVTWPLPT